jgi:hypothetical protein
MAGINQNHTNILQQSKLREQAQGGQDLTGQHTQTPSQGLSTLHLDTLSARIAGSL